MRKPALVFFGGIAFLGMYWQANYGESLPMIAIGLIGFTASLFIPKDFP